MELSPRPRVTWCAGNTHSYQLAPVQLPPFPLPTLHLLLPDSACSETSWGWHPSTSSRKTQPSFPGSQSLPWPGHLYSPLLGMAAPKPLPPLLSLWLLSPYLPTTTCPSPSCPFSKSHNYRKALFPPPLLQ
jgi:hypothetical protein